MCVYMCVQVLEQRGDGLWKGYVVQEGRMAKTGTFPANHVVLVDGQGQNNERNLSLNESFLSELPRRPSFLDKVLLISQDAIPIQVLYFLFFVVVLKNH